MLTVREKKKGKKGGGGETRKEIAPLYDPPKVGQMSTYKKKRALKEKFSFIFCFYHTAL